MPNAQDRRYAEIQKVVTIFLDENAEWTHAWSREDIAQAILTLTPYGRTSRWFDAIHRWEDMVLESTNAKETHWALLQGSIYAAHAA